jgi:hypothetical protein
VNGPDEDFWSDEPGTLLPFRLAFCAVCMADGRARINLLPAGTGHNLDPELGAQNQIINKMLK